MEIQFDKVLIDGSEQDIRDFSYNNGVVVDWREEEDLIVADFASRLENETLSAEYTDEGLIATYNGVKHEIPLTFSMRDRYLTIRGLMSILKDAYEIRVFDGSLGSDTHIFYIKPKEWWEYMDRNFSEAVKKIFFEIDDELDFGAGRDRFYAFGPDS